MPEERPDLALGHITLQVGDRAQHIAETLGIRTIAAGEQSAVQ